MKKKQTVKSGKKPITVEALVDQGNLAIANMNPELGVQFFRRALDMAPTSTQIMDALADACLQIGDQDQALALLEQSTAQAPTDNPFKWCYLAQLKSGFDAVGCYRHAIEIIMAHIQSQSLDEQTAIAFRKQAAKAFCSVAELYMTDLCFEEDAESSCEGAIMKALEIDSESIDAHQSLASLRLSQNRPDEASRIIGTVHARVQASRDALQARTIAQEISGATDAPGIEEAPEPDFCLTTAKLLIECSEVDRSHAHAAMDLLTSLLEDDDENVQLWYLAGFASLRTSPPDLQAARYHLEHARGLIEGARARRRTAMDDDGEGGVDEEPGDEEDCGDHYEFVMEQLGVLEQMESGAMGAPGGRAGARGLVVRAGGAGGAGGGAAMERCDDGEVDEEWSDDEVDDDDAMGTA